MRSKTRILVSLSPYLKERLVEQANKYGCSQAEILRTGLIKMLEEK